MSIIPAETHQTPLAAIATISRVVSAVVDRILGDRVESPLMVSAAVVEALKPYGIESRIMYGQAAWIEIFTDQRPVWAGCWGTNFHFWVATQYGEVVDLTTSVAHRKRAHQEPAFESLYSPPMLWSTEVPAFYRYIPEGIAELELTEERDQKRFQIVLAEIAEKCKPDLLNQAEEDLQFPNEPILCPGRRLLDDSRQTFKYYDRALAIHGIPEGPLDTKSVQNEPSFS